MSDDFFSHDLSSPPKQAASLTAHSVARQRKGPPPPPPRRPAGTATSATAAPAISAVATAATTGNRPRPTPSRPAVPATSNNNNNNNGNSTGATTNTNTTTSTTAATATSTAATTRPRPTPRSTTAKPTTTAARPLPTARSSRTAPVMSRPVGQYYAASTATQPVTPADDASAADTWDWGTPSPAPVADTWAPPNTNTWAAPVTDYAANSATTAATATRNEWYATETQPNATGMYTSSGFFEASTPQTTMAETAHDPFLSGTMDDGPVPAATSVFQPKTFTPQAPSLHSDSNFMASDEVPLLEELGINLEHIGMKTKAVILPFGRFGGHSMDPADIVKDADLAGPIAFCLVLGAEMVLTGKLQFGYIYGFGVFGCASMTLIVNLMSPLAEGVSIWTVSSVLGYALIPVNLLAAVKLIVINLVNLQSLGRFLGLLTVAWSTIASTRLLELGFGLREQRYLIAYPVALLYSAFVMITIF